jgi:(E)-4-hydroxy-3-methyl-but-2-enyl pyrophosphate reductase
MKVVLAREYGFCGGVRRALRKLDAAIAENPERPVYSIGEIIHNATVMAEYRSKGVEVLDSIFDIGDGVGVVRAHGLPLSAIEQATSRGLRVVDATCPYVRLISRIIKGEIGNGTAIYLVGEPRHPEVIAATHDYAAHVTVIDHASFDPDSFPFPKKSAVLLSQTTMAEEEFLGIADQFIARCQKVSVYNTICESTRARQRAALELAKKVDAMVVIGGASSSNTRRLFELCSGLTPSFLVEGTAELSPDCFAGCKTVGVTAGASTPEKLVSECVALLSAW